MNWQHWKTAVVGTACVALATAAIAAEPHKTYSPRPQSANRPAVTHTAAKIQMTKEMVTLDIYGANSTECARTLSGILANHQIHEVVQTSQNKPYRLTASIDPKTDLGACGEAVMKANTAEKATNPPSLDLVLFGKLDQASSKKAMDALAKIKGVDAHHSKVDTSAGKIQIRVNGGAKLTADEVHRALQDAGVWTQFSRSNASRTS